MTKQILSVPEMVDKFIQNRCYLSNGAGLLSKKWNSTKEEVKRAKKIAKNKIEFGTEYPKISMEELMNNSDVKVTEEILNKLYQCGSIEDPLFDNPKDIIIAKARRKGFNYGASDFVEDKEPNILVIDIETSPLLAWTFGRWNTNIYMPQVELDSFILTWSAKWLYAADIISMGLTPDEVKEQDDSRIIKELWDILEKADIIIAHNGNNFDIPRINVRFIAAGLGPVTPYKSIDTLKIAKQSFKFTSNKLTDLAIFFGFEPKLDTDMSLWIKCMKGDQEALDYMEEYNRYDVEVLEQIYFKLRAWDKSHPNLAVYMETNKPVCRVCGSNNLTTTGYHTTQVSKFKAVRCNDCGAVGRKRETIITKDKRKNLIMSIG